MWGVPLPWSVHPAGVLGHQLIHLVLPSEKAASWSPQPITRHCKVTVPPLFLGDKTLAAAAGLERVVREEQAVSSEVVLP